MAELIPMTVNRSPYCVTNIAIAIPLWTTAVPIAKYKDTSVDRKADTASPMNTGVLTKNISPPMRSPGPEKNRRTVNVMYAMAATTDTAANACELPDEPCSIRSLTTLGGANGLSKGAVVFEKFRFVFGQQIKV